MAFVDSSKMCVCVLLRLIFEKMQGYYLGFRAGFLSICLSMVVQMPFVLYFVHHQKKGNLKVVSTIPGIAQVQTLIYTVLMVIIMVMWRRLSLNYFFSTFVELLGRTFEHAIYGQIT